MSKRKLLNLIKKLQEKSRRIDITLVYENDTMIGLEPKELIEVLENKIVFKYIAKIFKYIEVMIWPSLELKCSLEEEILKIKKEGVGIETNSPQNIIAWVKIRFGYSDDGFLLYYPTTKLVFETLKELYSLI